MKTEAWLYDSRGETIAEFTRAQVALLALPTLARAAGGAVHLQISQNVRECSLPSLPKGCWRDWFGPKAVGVIVCRP